MESIKESDMSKPIPQPWLCRCGAVNAAWRTVCYRCGGDRKTSDTTVKVVDGLIRTLMTTCVILATTSPARSDDYRRWFDALRTVETGGHPDPARAVGDNGRSIGPYQISRAYWLDSRVPGKWTDVRDRRYAERVIAAYMRRYCPIAWSRRDWQTLSRIHNGGPAGYRRRATLGYWSRVQRSMR